MYIGNTLINKNLNMNFKITLALICMAFFGGSLSAQIIWGGPGDPNSEFAGGLNDWTTKGISSHVPDSAANAVWMWSPDGLSLGSLFGGDPIESESVANGAAIFDSDFLDNNGMIEFTASGNVDPNSVGHGKAPCFAPGGFSGAGHSGALISPTIDCAAFPVVNLRFFSYFRSFTGTMFVDVSKDDGATWTPFPVNTDDANETDPSNIVIMDISSVAANQATVKIQFRWVGSYYYWMIDDVSLIELPSNNLSMADNSTSPFYTPHSAVQPACAIETDTFFFATTVSNIGGDTVTNVVYKVEILNNDTGESIYVDSAMYDFIPQGYLDTILNIEERWAPEGLEPSIYRIIHSVYSASNPDDFNPNDNIVSQFFEVSDNKFAKEIVGNGAFGAWNNGSFYAIGVFYQFGANCIENYTISSVEYAVGTVGVDTEPLLGRPVEFWLWKLTDSFDNFNTDGSYEDNIATLSHPSMEFMAFAPDELDASDVAADLISSDAPFLNIDGDAVQPLLTGGNTYALFAHWGTAGSTSPLHLFTRDFNSTTDLFYSGGWFGGFTGTKSAPILGITTALRTSVDDKPLPEYSFKVFPNPANDYINIEVNLEKASDATITIANINGQVISYQNISKLSKDVVRVNVSDYVPGTYLARIATLEGTKTLKFVVK